MTAAASRPPRDWCARLVELLHRRPDLAGVGFAPLAVELADITPITVNTPRSHT